MVKLRDYMVSFLSFMMFMTKNSEQCYKKWWAKIFEICVDIHAVGGRRCRIVRQKWNDNFRTTVHDKFAVWNVCEESGATILMHLLKKKMRIIEENSFVHRHLTHNSHSNYNYHHFGYDENSTHHHQWVLREREKKIAYSFITTMMYFKYRCDR